MIRYCVDYGWTAWCLKYEWWMPAGVLLLVVSVVWSVTVIWPRGGRQ